MKPHYLFDATTGEFNGVYDAQESPLEPGVYIAPTHSTDIAPPTPGVNQVAIFAAGAWTLQPDYRGQIWYDAQGNGVEITAIGTPPNTLTSTLPAAILLANARAMQVAIIEAARDAARYANATALVGGVPHVWQADQKSVELLNGAITLAQSGLPLPPSWRSFDNVDVPITMLADLLAIAGAIAVQTQAAYSKSWTLKAQIAAATTVTAVQSVMW